ncbi:MAG TPA: hypothetical protein PKC98_01830 [Candidatus Melainabacteria bacterium]|nr:hypothetical protein [Candidatus Melainabacteria bacterium]
MNFKRFLATEGTFQTCLCAILIAIVMALSYGRSLGSYFLADDFGEIRYVYEIFQGDIGKLLSNFTGNYMQIPSMAVYRPWLLMSLSIDYAFWKTNAFGYYLTNLFHYYACALFIFLLLRRLTDYWGNLRSVLVSLSAALTFAACPLHCESVSWVVGRVDIVCLAFYLLGLLSVALFTENRNRRWLVLSLASFAMAICTKEMAIGLPVVASALAFLYAFPPDQKSAKLKERFKMALPVISSFGAATIIYFIIRFLTLGTLTGGYTGSIGASQISSLLTRWTDKDSLLRILFPFNYELAGDGGNLRLLLYLAYGIVFGLVIARSLFGKFPKRLLLLIGIFLATSLAPIYQLYGLGYNLEGMRFLFFATAPLAMLIPALIFAPGRGEKESKSQQLKELILSTSAILIILFVFSKTAYKNNSAWIEAGRQTLAISQAVQEQADKLQIGERLAVLGVPKENAGAHMILNGPTLSFTLAPPFFKETISDRILTFDSVLYGREDLLNSRHFKQSLSDPAVKEHLIWDFDRRAFVKASYKIGEDRQRNSLSIDVPRLSEVGAGYKKPMLLPYSKYRGYIAPITLKNDAVEINNMSQGGFEVAPLNIVPAEFDFLQLTINTADRADLAGKAIKLSWSGKSYLKAPGSGVHLYYLPDNLDASKNLIKLNLPLSTFWKWYAYEYINNIFLELPPTASIAVLEATLLPDTLVCPQITITPANSGSYGAYALTASAEPTIKVSTLENTEQVELEISKVNFFFENFPGSKSREAILTVKNVRLKSNESEATFRIPRSLFSEAKNGYSQIRARCKGKDGKNLGEFSAPVTLEILD